MDRGLLERYLAEGLSLAEIGRRVGRHEATVGYWVAKHRFQAAHGVRHAAKGAVSREDLERLVEAGKSIAEIAAAVDRSKTTVRHWLGRYGLKTLNGSGRRRSSESLRARDAGLRTVGMMCPVHGATDYVLDGRGYDRCRRCRAEAVSRRRRKVKAILVQEAGGACLICGYTGNMRALHFHHVAPADKRIELNARGVALAVETLRAEARKCVLLCSNCHAEVEDGSVQIPDAALDSALSASRRDNPG